MKHGESSKNKKIKTFSFEETKALIHGKIKESSIELGVMVRAEKRKQKNMAVKNARVYA